MYGFFVRKGVNLAHEKKVPDPIEERSLIEYFVSALHDREQLTCTILKRVVAMEFAEVINYII